MIMVHMHVKASGFRGVEVCGETTVVVTNDPQSFAWEGYGLKLHIPKGCLPAGVEQCTINIKASLAGQYEFPENSHLVSAVFWLRCKPKCVFKKPVSLEINHCAKSENVSKLSFVKALCTQEELPYTFHTEVGGKFSQYNSYGTIDLESFSALSVAQDGSDEREYCAILSYFDQTIISHKIHFVIVWNLEAHLTVVKRDYEKENASFGPDQVVEFESSKITLNIPLEGITFVEGWKITPHMAPVVMKKHVDSYRPGLWIPKCQLSAVFILEEDNKIPLLQHQVKLIGATEPFNMIAIELPTISAYISRDNKQLPRDQTIGRVLKMGITPEDVAVKAGIGLDVLSKECSKTVLLDVAKLCVNWQLIGKHLKLTEAEIAAVNGDKGTVEEKRIAMLEKWRERFAYEATYRELFMGFLVAGKTSSAVEAASIIRGVLDNTHPSAYQLCTDVATAQEKKKALEAQSSGGLRVMAQLKVEQEIKEQLYQAEEKVKVAESRTHNLHQRVQEAERRAKVAHERATEAEERSQNLEATLTQERLRAQESERRCEEAETLSRAERCRADQRVREMSQELAASRELERAAEVRAQEAQQQAQQNAEEMVQAIEEQLYQTEKKMQAAERRLHDLQEEKHEAEQRAHQRIQDAEQRSRNAEQRIAAVERQLHEVEQRARESEQRARESERRARQAEALVQQNQQESHWLVRRREIELTEEERGRGGWAVVKVANFRGTRVAAKCFYQEILVSHYNRQLFNREMNMAARLRHPNLVQFIGASLEGEPIILAELMSTSLRAELEKGPMEHAHITSISQDVARALNYLHLMQPYPIIHRDISSANVLLDPLPGNGWKAKVSDYGSVNLLRELHTVGPGNPVYAAPEASIPAQQSPKMDIFSFGVLLIEMLTDEFPIEDARQRLLDSINYAGHLDLIGRCLREQKEDRPSANEIIAEISEM